MEKINNDQELVRAIAAKLKIPIAYHVGSLGCKKCNGTGFVPISFLRKLRAHYIEGVPWCFIRKEVFCKCKGSLIFEYPEQKEPQFPLGCCECFLSPDLPENMSLQCNSRTYGKGYGDEMCRKEAKVKEG